MSIVCIFRNQNIFIKVILCLGKHINESVYSVSYHLISGPISYHYRALALQLLAWLQAMSPDRLGRCTLIFRLQQLLRVHYQIIIDNAVSYLSHSLFLIKMNCNAGPINFLLSFNNTGMHVLSFDSQFEIFSCFLLGKCSVNRPQEGRTIEGDK